MPSFSNISIAGHLGKDAEVRQVGDTQCVSFSVAVTRKRKDIETTTWWRCQWWGDRAAKVAQWLTKGKAVLVSGEAFERPYQKDGKDQRSLEIEVSGLQLLGDGQTHERQEAQPVQRGPVRPVAAASADDDGFPPF